MTVIVPTTIVTWTFIIPLDQFATIGTIDIFIIAISVYNSRPSAIRT